jgi:hypothetical protein
MKYLIKNKTSKTIVFLVNGSTQYLYAKGKKRDRFIVDELTPQIKNIKKMRFIQISKVGG